MKPTARRVADFGANPFAEMTALAVQHDAVNLGQGFPDFPPPDFVLQAAQEAFLGQAHQYAPPKGWPRLMRAVSASLEASLGYTPNPDLEVTITHGATEAMYSATQALLNPGDEAIIIEPQYDMYTPQVVMAGGQPVYVQLELVGGAWTLDLDRLRTACTNRTKLLILNTPHNPTGKVFTRTELEGIAALAHEFDFFVLSDEVYDRLTYGVPHVRIASLPGMWDRTVTVGSAGKALSVTGWRIGWAVTNPTVSDAIRRGHQWVPFCAATPVQEAVAIALEQASVNGYDAQMQAMFQSRRDTLDQALRNAGLETNLPDGGYFSTVDARDFVPDAHTLARAFVTEVGVAPIPMTVFYADKTRAPRVLRFAFCKTQATLEAAAERLTRNALERLRIKPHPERS
jgi:aspartate/methionine/tyrosine aminotransferase